MKVIYVNESALSRIREEGTKRPPFKDFYDSVMGFIRDMFKDPMDASPNNTLASSGLKNGEFRKKLLDYGILKKKEWFDEPYDEATGKQQSRYYAKYDWSDAVKKELKDYDDIGKPIRGRIERLYNDLYNISESYHTPNGLMMNNNCLGNDLAMRAQIDMMLKSPTTLGILSCESMPSYVKQAVEIYNNEIKKRKRHEK